MIRLTSVKPARLTRSSICLKFSYHCKLRNASTATTPSPSNKTKSKIRNQKATSKKENSSKPTPTPPDYLLSGRPLNQAWTIEPQVGYWNAKLRTTVPEEVVVLTIFLALSSVVLTSLAYTEPSPSISPPSPSASPSSEDAPTSTPKPTRSILDFLIIPVNLIFRPALVDDEAHLEAQQSWMYWLGCAAGLSAFTILTVSQFVTPRYIQRLTISPSPSPSPSAISLLISGNSGGGILRIRPALGRSVAHPIADTVLISPSFVEDVHHPKKVLTTIRIKGPNGALRGWGVNMFRDGAVVNGKLLRQQDVISLMERIWVDRGGKIDVGR